MKAVSAESFSELCREYGISRKTGYKWRERFVTKGTEGMEEESRRPLSSPNLKLTLLLFITCRFLFLVGSSLFRVDQLPPNASTASGAGLGAHSLHLMSN